MNTSCFAHGRSARCNILTVERCEGADCPFRKTEAQYAAGMDQSHRLLAQLDLDHQRYIARKYYDGRMLWRKDGGRDDR